MTPIARFAALALLCGAPFAQAAEVRAAFGGWRYELSGVARDGSRIYDFERDLELNTVGHRSALLEWDTPRGAWPDWAVSYAQIGADGRHQETFTVVGGPLPVEQTRTIVTRGSFDDVDLVARYPLRLGPTRLAAGLALKRLRGDFTIDDTEEGAPSRQSYDEVFPQVHAQLRWPAWRVLVLAASVQGIEYDGSSAWEWRVGGELRVWQPLLLEIGWQQKTYDISVDDYALDADLAGALMRVGLLFR